MKITLNSRTNFKIIRLRVSNKSINRPHTAPVASSKYQRSKNPLPSPHKTAPLSNPCASLSLSLAIKPPTPTRSHSTPKIKPKKKHKKDTDLRDQHHSGYEEHRDRIRRLPDRVSVRPEQHDGDESLAGARLEKHDRVLLDRLLQRLQLITKNNNKINQNHRSKR